MTLLTTGNTKTMKGERKGYKTYILHLAPANLSGYNVCPMASAQCAALCLNTAGRGGMFKTGENTNAIQEARIRKTKMFFENRNAFLGQLVREIDAAIRSAHKRGETPVFRLNGTSDLRWETTPIDVTYTFGRKVVSVKADNIFDAFPTVQFYDYRKTKADLSTLPANYHLTFSRSEDNEARMLDILRNGGNVAVVFGTTKVENLPATWNGYTVINGDESDLRFLDPKNVVVGLTAKGRAKKAPLGGFVVAV